MARCKNCGQVKRYIIPCSKCSKEVCINCFNFIDNVCINCEVAIYAEKYFHKIHRYKIGELMIR